MSLLQLYEEEAVERKQIDCVEVYLPKSVEYLSELYAFLRSCVKVRIGAIVLDGFSVYEVDGVFHGEKLWEQRTLVIRILIVRPAETPELQVHAKITALGRAIAGIAPDEEQIWICHYQQRVAIFRPKLL